MVIHIALTMRMFMSLIKKALAHNGRCKGKQEELALEPLLCINEYNSISISTTVFYISPSTNVQYLLRQQTDSSTLF